VRDGLLRRRKVHGYEDGERGKTTGEYRNFKGKQNMICGMLLNQNEIAVIREKIKKHKWAENAFRRVRHKAEEVFLTNCPKTLGAMVNALEAAAVIYSISGEQQFAAGAEEVLKNNLNFPELFGEVTSDTYNFGCNTLLTGLVLPHLCTCLDLLQDGLAKETRRHVLDNIILPAARHLQTNNRCDCNWQTCHSAGLLAAGIISGDRELINFAIDDQNCGIRRHLTIAFRSDGLQWEGSLGYHLHTLTMLMLAAEMARHIGIDLFSEGGNTPFIKRMLDVPIKLAFPDLSLPTNNDAHQTALADFEQLYELGYARYHDPAYGWLIEKNDRASLFSLLFGEEDIQAVPPGSKSCNLEQSGWTIIKGVEGSNYWRSDCIASVMDHGPHGDWHGHPDKLGIEVFAGGLRWIQDAGSPTGYHCRQHWEYFRRTLAHNTVVVDCQDQLFERANDNALEDIKHTGKLIEFNGNTRSVCASVDWAYPGVGYTRTLSIKDASLTDRFEITSGDLHTYDYILHGRGMVEIPSLSMEEGRFDQIKGGYEYFVNVSRTTTDDGWTAIFKDGGWPDGNFSPTGKKFEIRVAGAPGTEIYTGYSPSHLIGVYIPFILVRRKTKDTIFQCVMQTIAIKK